jgi:hypothetical protein
MNRDYAHGQLGCWKALPISDQERDEALDEVIRGARVVGMKFDTVRWVQPNETVGGWVIESRA